MWISRVRFVCVWGGSVHLVCVVVPDDAEGGAHNLSTVVPALAPTPAPAPAHFPAAIPGPATPIAAAAAFSAQCHARIPHGLGSCAVMILPSPSQPLPPEILGCSDPGPGSCPAPAASGAGVAPPS